MTIAFSITIVSLGCSTYNSQKIVGEPLAPGTIDAIVILAKYDKTKNAFAEIKLTKVNGYGVNTSPIAVNSVITADVFLINAQKDLESAQVGSELNVLLKLNHGGMNLTPPNKFEIIRIIK